MFAARGGFEYYALPGSNNFLLKTTSINSSSINSSYGLAATSDGSLMYMVTGQLFASVTAVILLAMDQYGNLQWARYLSGAGISSGSGNSTVVLDSSNNIVAMPATINPGGAGLVDILLYKYNSSGTLQWQKNMGQTQGDYALGVGVDSSGNIYTNTILTPSAANYEGDISKFTSAGVWSSGGYIGTGSGTAFPAGTANAQGMFIDSSNNVYTVIQNTVSTRRIGYINKWTSSLGTSTWGRTWSHATNSVYPTCVTVDSAGNVFAAGVNVSSPQLVKYNSSGTVQWSTGIGTGGGGTVTVRGLATDSSNNLYVIGATANATEVTWIGKINGSTGALTWSRYFKSPAGSSTADGLVTIKWVSTNQIIISGFSQYAPSGAIILKVPDDGTLTGTYNGYTYGVSSRALTTVPTYTDGTNTQTTNSQAMTITTGSLTSGSFTSGNTITPIP